ncbi:MAG TPA: signal peptidase I, partial [Dehalococcoidia bacterium]|nr:signal peptidase I [Dehalococcoidia bacterium]
MGFSLEGKDALRYANLRLLPADFAANLRWLRVAIRRVVVYGSAVAIAIVISGGIFSLTPLVGIRLVHTQGTSMEPRQKNGDVILVKEVNGARAQIGDVVVFEDDGRSFMHRVIQRYTDASGRLMLVTQGDNVPVPDHPILASQVKARMLTEIPVLGDASR